MSYVFGPVPSRRLGRSLGVDLISPKTCSFDCLYCQVGRTTRKTVDTGCFVPLAEIAAEIKDKLLRSAPDTVTLAGSGEPTLYSHIDGVIDCIKGLTDIRVALLTNGSLFWREEIRRRVLHADLILPTLSTAFETTFQWIHRPHPALVLSRIVEGLKALRREYDGLFFLEVVLLAGINDNERELEGLKRLLAVIAPDKIQLNTVVRPPADRRAVSLDKKRLEEIKVFFGKGTEIVAETAAGEGKAGKDSAAREFLDMVERRPLTAMDASKALGLSMGEVDDLLHALLIKGRIRRLEQSGKTYYLSDGKDVA